MSREGRFWYEENAGDFSAYKGLLKYLSEPNETTLKRVQSSFSNDFSFPLKLRLGINRNAIESFLWIKFVLRTPFTVQEIEDVLLFYRKHHRKFRVVPYVDRRLLDKCAKRALVELYGVSDNIALLDGIEGSYVFPENADLPINKKYWKFCKDESSEVDFYGTAFSSNAKFNARMYLILETIAQQAVKFFQSSELELNFAEYSLKDCEKISLYDITGHQFERFCAEQLRQKGYRDVKIVSGSSDLGIDITAEKNQRTIGFQCKRLTRQVGKQVICDVVAGRGLLKLDEVAIISASGFSSPLIDAAEKSKVQLIPVTELYSRS